MAKVDILTFHSANNAGAVLQAYGLVQALRNLGHRPTVVDYRPAAARRYYQPAGWRRPFAFLRHPAGYLRKQAMRLAFDRFRQECLPLSRAYDSWEDLRESPPPADYAICGSDQVWNIHLATMVGGFDPAYFLDYPEESGLRRVSYAATFGNADDLGTYRQRIGDLLSRFAAISVRDRKSQQMVRALSGRNAAQVLDPCFLADFEPITPPPVVREPYAFLFCFDVTPLTLAAVRILRERLGVAVVSAAMPDMDGVTACRFGPLEWLSLVRHAQFVCTNSFHGTCFSIIHRKPFAVLPNRGKMSRIEDLLETAGLSGRIAADPDTVEAILNRSIDYGPVSARIDSARNGSLAFLRDAVV